MICPYCGKTVEHHECKRCGISFAIPPEKKKRRKFSIVCEAFADALFYIIIPFILLYIVIHLL